MGRVPCRFGLSLVFTNITAVTAVDLKVARSGPCISDDVSGFYKFDVPNRVLIVSMVLFLCGLGEC